MNRDKQIYELRLKLQAYLQIEDTRNATRIFNQLIKMMKKVD